MPNVRRHEAHVKRGGDPVIVAILAEIEVVDRTLAHLRAPLSAYDDIRQVVTWTAWREALRGMVEWRSPKAMRAFLRVLTARTLYEWWAHNPMHAELRDDANAFALDPERILIAKRMLRFLRESTTPERWRAVRAHAKGISAPQIARREGVPSATIFTRLRLAREDFAAALAREDASIYVRRRK